MALTDPKYSGLTEQQKIAVSANTGWDDARIKQADMMLAYNAQKNAPTKIDTNTQPQGTLVNQTANTTTFDITPTTPNALFNPPANTQTSSVQPVAQTTQPTTTTTTKVETPAVTTPTTTPTTTAKTEPVVDYTKVAGREAEVLANLIKAYDSGMKTPEAIKTFAGYDQSSPEKKAFVDQFIASKTTPPNANAIFGNLIQGAYPTDSNVLNSNEYKVAKQRFDNFNRYSNLSVKSLTSALNSGAIIPWTQAYNDLATNPVTKAKLAEAEKFKKPNIVDTKSVWEKVSSTIIANNPTTSKALEDGVITIDEYKWLLTTPEIYAKMKERDEALSKYNKIKSEYKNIEDSVRNEYQWRGLMENELQALISGRQRSLSEKLNEAKDEYDIIFWTLTELKADQAKVVEQNLKSQESAQAFARQKQLADYQAQLWLQTKQAEFEQWLKQQEALANDPYTAIKSIMDTYQKEGIPFTQDITKKLADFKASGKTLQEYTTQMIKDIQSKPEFKRMQAIQLGKLSDIEKLKMTQNFELAQQAAKNVAKNKWTKLDDWLYQDENGNIATSDDLKTAKLVNNTYLSANKWDVWGDCGFYASRATGLGSTPGGNSKVSRITQFSDTTPQIWWMALFTWSGYDQTYGHIAIVTGVDEANGTITLKESNYNGDKKVTERTVPISSATGFYNNTPLAKWVGWTATERKYTDSDVALLASIEKIDKNAQTALADVWLSTADWAKFKAWQMPATTAQKEQATSLINTLNAIEKHDGLSDAVWFKWLQTGYTMPWSDKADFETLFANLKDSLAFNNIDKLKGAMSDKDIEFLRNTAAAINLDQSEESFKKAITDLKTKYQNILNKNQKTETQPQTQPQTSTWRWQSSQTWAGITNTGRYNPTK